MNFLSLFNHIIDHIITACALHKLAVGSLSTFASNVKVNLSLGLFTSDFVIILGDFNLDLTNADNGSAE